MDQQSTRRIDLSSANILNSRYSKFQQLSFQEYDLTSYFSEILHKIKKFKKSGPFPVLQTESTTVDLKRLFL